MRQILFSPFEFEATDNALDGLDHGAIAFVKKDGFCSDDSADVSDGVVASIALHRYDSEGGPVVLPIFAKDFSWSKSIINSQTVATKQVDLSAVVITPGFEYTVIAVKKGVGFNERNRYTASVVAGDTDTATTIATKIAKYFADNEVTTGLRVVDGKNGKLTFTAGAGDAWKLLLTDGYSSVADVDLQPALNSAGKLCVPSIVDYLNDLAAKCAADAGFEYTYREADVYPGLTGKGGVDLSGFGNGTTVYTLRFAEPRQVKTVDTLVHQIIQVVFPNKDDLFESFLDNFAQVGRL